MLDPAKWGSPEQLGQRVNLRYAWRLGAGLMP